MIDESGESCRSGVVVLLCAFHTWQSEANQTTRLAGPGLVVYADLLDYA